MMNTGKENPAGRSPLVRITAGILAVIMLSGIVLYQRTGVVPDPASFSDRSSRIAARELLRGNDYANSSRLARMTAFARNLLGGHHSQEELELGAQIAIAQANYEDAIALTLKMMESFEGDEREVGRLCLRLGYLYTMTRDWDQALEWLTKGITYAPGPEAYLSRAQVLLNLDRTEEALRDVMTYLDTAENPEELIPDLINVFEAAGDFETAASLYTGLIERSGGEGYLLNRAYCYTSLGRMEDAEADRGLYEAAGGAEIASVDVMLGIGWMRGGEYGRAAECFARAIEEKYADPESLYYYVVLCAYVNGDYSRACEYGDRLIERIARGDRAENAGFEVEKATGNLKVTLARMDVSTLCLMTGASHVRLGNYEQAAESLTACLNADQGKVYAYYLRGSCLLAAERFAEAIADFDAALAAGEEPEKSHYGRGVCRMETGDRDGAIEDFEWVLFHGTDEELFQEAAQLIMELNKEEEQK